MSDPLGLIGGMQAGLPVASASGAVGGARAPAGASFEKELVGEIRRQIDEVNRLQADADMAAEDLAAGRRADVEGVMLATQKADTAFRMLLAVRNKMMEAYEEVKQIRV